MTRINLVPPSELTDQHLFAEFREIKMVPKSLRRSLEAAARYTSHPREHVLRKVPTTFTLNTGHVSFFYDKGVYLNKRYIELREELALRGINFDRNSMLDPDCVFYKLDSRFNKDYTPTEEALILIRARITERVADKPFWYRYYGYPIVDIYPPYQHQQPSNKA